MLQSNRVIQGVLRIGIAGEFLGHGVFALQGKAAWIEWVTQLLNVGTETATTIITIVGIVDLCVAAIVLFAPIPAVLLWAAAWGFWTALVRPLVGEPIWDFIERWANWAAPLALLLIYGMPSKLRDWFRLAR